MNTTRNRLAVSLLILFVASACLSLFGQDQQALDSEHTEAARTIIAQFTQAARETAVGLLTLQAELATLTPQPSTPTPLPTQTPSPVPTDTPIPSPTNTAAPCDQAQFVQDVTLPPGSIIPAGARFTKTWRLMNVGACEWTPSYALVFAGGEMMGSVSAFYLPGTVPPGGTVDVSATLNAPPFPGSYLGNWLLRNASGELFGVGGGEAPLQVQINAVQSSTAQGYEYDFAADYCAAEWSSQVSALNCPGIVRDPAGSVTLVNNPDFENRRLRGYGLWSRPNQRVDGLIRGYYPYFFIDPNDHFLAELGCLRSSLNCDLIFQLEYQTVGGLTASLGRWRERNDGLTTSVDIDLSNLAGQRVRFILTTYNDGDPAEADAIWMSPRIQNTLSQYSLALNWSREGFPNPSSCNELDVYLIGDLNGEARAFSCSQGKRELGRMALSQDDVDRLSSWTEQLENFDSQTYRASPEQPIVSWIYLYGRGNSTAQDSDIQAILNFATRLFEQIVGSNPIQ